MNLNCLLWNEVHDGLITSSNVGGAASEDGATRFCPGLFARDFGWMRPTSAPRASADNDRWSVSSPGRTTQALETRRGHLPRCWLAACPPSCQTGCRQQPALVPQLGDGAQQSVAERSFKRLGVSRLTSTHRSARCGAACRMGWQGTRTTSARRC